MKQRDYLIQGILQPCFLVLSPERNAQSPQRDKKRDEFHGPLVPFSKVTRIAGFGGSDISNFYKAGQRVDVERAAVRVPQKRVHRGPQ